MLCLRVAVGRGWLSAARQEPGAGA